MTGHDEYVTKYLRSIPKDYCNKLLLLHEVPLAYFCMQFIDATSREVESRLNKFCR